jgi:hypothetical protein
MSEKPDDELVVQVIEAGLGASAADICGHFKTLYLHGRKRGSAKGPRGFGWFVAVTGQYFTEQRAIEQARLNPNAAID